MTYIAEHNGYTVLVNTEHDFIYAQKDIKNRPTHTYGWDWESKFSKKDLADCTKYCTD